MIATSIQLPPDVQAQVSSFAAQYGFDPLVASAVAQVSSGGKQFNPDGSLVITPFGVGVMGISKDVATALGLDATTQLGNIQAGCATLAILLNTFVGNYPLTLSAYVTSVATVRFANAIPPLAPVNNFVYNVTKIAENAGSTNVSAVVTLLPPAFPDASSYASASGELIDKKAKGHNYLSNPSTSAENLAELQATMEPLLQIPDDTLTNTAWYDDQGLVTGNPRIRNSVQPVTFTVFYDRNDPNQMLRNPTTGAPIEVQLNTSLSSFEISSKHVYNRTPSRTGMHITLWGMEPDLISGSGTTGVFMNQFGLTDFMSTAGINDDVLKLVSRGIKHGFNKAFSPTVTEVVVPSATVIGSDSDVTVVTDPQASTGVVTSAQVGNDAVANLRIAGGGTIGGRNGFNVPDEAFRVAAQDMFVEFLKLFQMNGSVWYHSTAYANGVGKNGKFNASNLGVIGQTQQEAPTAWSFKTGASSFQQHARNNDVMTRGYVAMNYRNNVYLGYFKSMTWTQDAESPFQWKFQFSFQVEKTYTSLYFARATAQFPSGQILV